MRRARRLIVFALAPLAACNAILGIHDPEIDPATGLPDATVDDSPAKPDANPGDADAAIDAGPDSPSGRCPTKGGPMHDFGTFCIDSTEVTNAAYAVFVDAGAPIDGGTACAYKGGKAATAVDEQKPTYPIAFVDWCDARAFCEWAAKRLCGRTPALDGAHAITTSELGNYVVSEWVAACSNRGTQVFQYGNTFDASACNVLDSGVNVAEPVGERASCQGPEAGLFDLGGNLWEWVDSCDLGDAGRNNDPCRFIGGSFKNGYPCNAFTGFGRGGTSDDIGIRCCADPKSM
jgi:sulfatase modifying factor 1